MRPAGRTTARVSALALIAGLAAAPGLPTAEGSRGGGVQEGDGEPGVVLFLGDSLSAGLGVAPEAAFPALIEDRIDARGWDWRVVNAGVSGDTTSGGVARLDWLLRRPLDVLVLELGANDGLRGLDPAMIRDNLREIVHRTRKRHPEADIVVAGMRVPPNLGAEYSREFQEVFRGLAESEDLHLIPFLLDGVAGRPELNLPDGIHPNARGHRVAADNVWEVLEPVLRDRQRRRPER